MRVEKADVAAEYLAVICNHVFVSWNRVASRYPNVRIEACRSGPGIRGRTGCSQENGSNWYQMGSFVFGGVGKIETATTDPGGQDDRVRNRQHRLLVTGSGSVESGSVLR